MRLTIDKPGLAKALAHVASVVERRNTIPILSNVLLSTAKNELKLTATDLDMELVETVPCKAKGEGATTVPAHMFHDIVRKLPEGRRDRAGPRRRAGTAFDHLRPRAVLAADACRPTISRRSASTISATASRCRPAT